MSSRRRALLRRAEQSFVALSITRAWSPPPYETPKHASLRLRNGDPNSLNRCHTSHCQADRYGQNSYDTVCQRPFSGRLHAFLCAFRRKTLHESKSRIYFGPVHALRKYCPDEASGYAQCCSRKLSLAGSFHFSARPCRTERASVMYRLAYWIVRRWKVDRRTRG
jgi:hypothetical protein